MYGMRALFDVVPNPNLKSANILSKIYLSNSLYEAPKYQNQKICGFKDCYYMSFQPI